MVLARIQPQIHVEVAVAHAPDTRDRAMNGYTRFDQFEPEGMVDIGKRVAWAARRRNRTAGLLRLLHAAAGPREPVSGGAAAEERHQQRQYRSERLVGQGHIGEHPQLVGEPLKVCRDTACLVDVPADRHHFQSKAASQMKDSTVAKMRPSPFNKAVGAGFRCQLALARRPASQETGVWLYRLWPRSLDAMRKPVLIGAVRLAHTLRLMVH